MQRVVTGLAPSTEYRCTFAQRGSGGASAPGLFRTAPKASTNVKVRFAISGDADATPGRNGRPGFNNFETYGQMAAERNDFNINLGDTSATFGRTPLTHSRHPSRGVVQYRRGADQLLTEETVRAGGSRVRPLACLSSIDA